MTEKGILRGRLRIAFELFDLKDDEKTLDLGCASGYFIRRLHARARGCFTVGVDLNRRALITAKKSSCGELVCCDAHLLPFVDHFFDNIACLELLEHADDDEGVIKEAHRVLSNNGKLVVSVPRYNVLFNLLDPAYWLTHTHKRRYRTGVLSKILQANNFIVLTSKSAGFIVFQLHFLITAFLQKARVQLPRVLDNFIMKIVDREFFKNGGSTLFLRAIKVDSDTRAS